MKRFTSEVERIYEMLLPDSMTEWVRDNARLILKIPGNRLDFRSPVRLRVSYQFRQKHSQFRSCRLKRLYDRDCRASVYARHMCELSQTRNGAVSEREGKRERKVGESRKCPDLAFRPRTVRQVLTLRIGELCLSPTKIQCTGSSLYRNQWVLDPFNETPIAFVQPAKADDLLPAARNQHFAWCHLKRMSPEEK